MMQIWENGKNTKLGPNFGPPNFLVSFTSTRYTLFQSIILYNLKENYWTKLEKMVKIPI